MIVDAHCLEAQRYMILHQLCREGNYQDAASRIGELIEVLDREEPKNPYLFDEFAKVLSRMVRFVIGIS